MILGGSGSGVTPDRGYAAKVGVKRSLEGDQPEGKVQKR